MYTNSENPGFGCKGRACFVLLPVNKQLLAPFFVVSRRHQQQTNNRVLRLGTNLLVNIRI